MRYITYFQGIMAHLLYILIYKGFTFIYSQLFLKIKKRRRFFIAVKIIYLHYEKILNFFDKRSTNAASESFNSKIKAFRAQFRGVKDKDFFLFRLAKLYA